MLHTYVRHANEGEFQLATPGTFVRDLGVGDITDGELTAQVVHIEPEGAYIEETFRRSLLPATTRAPSRASALRAPAAETASCLGADLSYDLSA